MEQNNGAIVRRMVGYGRLRGRVATQQLATLYEGTHWFINFFQPSFKLLSKTREGAQVRKRYDRPQTPWERLLAMQTLSAANRARLHAQWQTLDPITLLQANRSSQQKLAERVDRDSNSLPPLPEDIPTFLKALKQAWKQAEVRPTHRPHKRPPRHWRTRPDPMSAVWLQVLPWLEQEPELSATVILSRLTQRN